MKKFAGITSLAAVAITTLFVAFAAGPALGEDAIKEEPYVYEGGEVGPEIDPDAPAPPTASSQEAKLLAEIHGVSTDEAFEIALWMGQAETALQKVRSAYPDTYAGGAFDHDNGSIRIDLWVTGDGEAEKTLFDSFLPTADFASSDVKEAPLSEFELVASFAKTARETPELFGAQSVDDVVGGLDFKTGRFVPADPVLMATGQEDGHNRCIHGTFGWLEAGRLLKLDPAQC